MEVEREGGGVCVSGVDGVQRLACLSVGTRGNDALSQQEM